MYEGTFDCKQCGECCLGFGGTYVGEKDIRAIADYLKLKEEELVKEFCSDSANGLVLAVNEEGRCVFQKDLICSIHPVKPRMCREWPFIPAVLRQPGNWKLMGDACPGINTEALPEKVYRQTIRSLEQTRPGFKMEDAIKKRD